MQVAVMKKYSEVGFVYTWTACRLANHSIGPAIGLNYELVEVK